MLTPSLLNIEKDIRDFSQLENDLLEICQFYEMLIVKYSGTGSFHEQIVTKLIETKDYYLSQATIVRLLKEDLEELKKKFDEGNGLHILLINEEEGDNMEISIDKNGKLKAKILDRAGNEAQLDGKLSWSADKENMVGLQPSEDGLECQVNALMGGDLGELNIKAEGDAREGEEVKLISGSKAIRVKAGEGDQVIIEEV